MTNKNIDLMKKLIEAKKQKSSQQSGSTMHEKSIGEKRSAIKKIKKSGLFDK